MGKRPKGDLELFKYIGSQIKKARLDNVPARLDGQKSPSAMTQTALGNAIGVTFQQVQKYEKGMNRVPIDKLLAIGIKTMKEDINYFLPHTVNDKETNTLTNVIHPCFGYSISRLTGLIQYFFHHLICSCCIDPLNFCLNIRFTALARFIGFSLNFPFIITRYIYILYICKA